MGLCFAETQMAKLSVRNGNGSRQAGTNKYDAQNSVLSQTYGALADLRRELSDTRSSVAEREDLLRQFAECGDPQRSWLLLEDYFEKLALSRRDFSGEDWWPRLLAERGTRRLEELAFLFMRAKRPLPNELQPHASIERFVKVEEAERELKLVRELEGWLFPPKPALLDQPRASLRVVGTPQPDEAAPARQRLAVQFLLSRPRTGEKVRTLREMIELVTRAAHEEELFAPADWEFIKWLAETHKSHLNGAGPLVLSDAELLHWLARWGHTTRLESAGGTRLGFEGQVAELCPHLENGERELAFTHLLKLPDGQKLKLDAVRFFTQQPPLVLAGDTFYLLRNAPPPAVIEHWAERTSVPVRKLSHRLLTHLRRTQSKNGLDWEQL